ncbi:MAG: VWA domain-containing protein [Armatimonadetes bacterium]|nr:VWA domain-containing protein [Armatimonadota bacterium]
MRMRQQLHSLRRRRPALGLLVALVIALSGCDGVGTLRLDVLIDTSGSTVQARLQQPALRQAVARVLLALDPYGPTIGLWRFDAVSACVYENQPSAAVALAQLAGEQFTRRTTLQGTRPDLALAEVTRAWRRDEADVIGLVMVTDGEMTAPDAMLAAVRGMVAEPRLRVVWVVGVADELRAEVHRVYAPLGGRLMVSGQSRPDSLDGMRRFVERVEGEVL